MASRGIRYGVVATSKDYPKVETMKSWKLLSNGSEDSSNIVTNNPKNYRRRVRTLGNECIPYMSITSILEVPRR